MTPVMMFIVSRAKEMELREVLFTLMATGVLNIYVFNINKEMIQILYFFAIYIVISLPIKNTFIKVLGCSAVYYMESMNFRSYYIIMASMTVLVYFIFRWLRKRERIRRRHIVITVLLCFIGVFVFFYASQFVAYEDYMEAMNVRDGTTLSLIHIFSTDEVYGDLPLDRPDLFFTEETPIHTSSPYSLSLIHIFLLSAWVLFRQYTNQKSSLLQRQLPRLQSISFCHLGLSCTHRADWYKDVLRHCPLTT